MRSAEIFFVLSGKSVLESDLMLLVSALIHVLCSTILLTIDIGPSREVHNVAHDNDFPTVLDIFSPVVFFVATFSVRVLLVDATAAPK